MGCGQTVEDIGLDTVAAVAAPFTGGVSADLIPVINAGVSAANGGSLTQDLEAGGEALAGQELAGAVGVGSGNDTFNSALGITGDNPAGTGLPDIGGALNSAIGATGGNTATGTYDVNGNMVPTSTNAANATVNADTGQTVAPSSTPTSVGASSGSVTGAGSVGDLGAQSINSQFANGLDQGQNLTNLSDTASGTGTSVSPQLGSLTANTGAASDSAIGASGTDAIGSTPAEQNFLTQAQNSAATTNATGNIVGGAAGGGAGSSPSLLQQAEGAGIKAALPLGSLAYEAIKGPSQLPGSATQLEAGGAATAPLLALENQGATEAQTGQLTPAQQATIQQGVQQQQNQLIQQLASQGVTNPTQDSRYIAGMQQIQQWAAAQQQQYITAAISEATSAGGAASSNIATAANEQIQNDTDFQNALAAAFGALGGSIGGVNVKV